MRFLDKATLILRRTLGVYRDYNDGKKQLAELSVNTLESKARPLIALVFLGLILYVWFAAITSGAGIEVVLEIYGFYPILAIFVLTYFFVFIGSKVVLKPSLQELTDDTSVFALFSACERREYRSLISVVLAAIHAVALSLYLVNQDLDFLP